MSSDIFLQLKLHNFSHARLFDCRKPKESQQNHRDSIFFLNVQPRRWVNSHIIIFRLTPSLERKSSCEGNFHNCFVKNTHPSPWEESTPRASKTQNSQEIGLFRVSKSVRRWGSLSAGSAPRSTTSLPALPSGLVAACHDPISILTITPSSWGAALFFTFIFSFFCTIQHGTSHSVVCLFVVLYFHSLFHYHFIFPSILLTIQHRGPTPKDAIPSLIV